MKELSREQIEKKATESTNRKQKRNNKATEFLRDKALQCC